MRFSARDDIVSLTPLNPFDRFDNGCSKIPDALLDEMKLVTLEEAWHVLSRKHGYDYQFGENWVNLQPDLGDVVNVQGECEGWHGRQGNWLIQGVVEKDVVAVNPFGKVKYGTFVGDNLSTAVSSQKGAGLVIDGGIRDPGGLYDVSNINVFCRGLDFTSLRDVTLISLSGPTRIGQATVLPGDVVLVTMGGVIFIPPHLVEEVVTALKQLEGLEG